MELPSNDPTSEQNILFFRRLNVLKHFMGTEARGITASIGLSAAQTCSRGIQTDNFAFNCSDPERDNKNPEPTKVWTPWKQ